MAATILIAVIVAVAFIAALRYSLKHHTSCAECAGGDPSCTLERCQRPSQKNAERFRQERLDALWNESKNQ